MWKLSFLIPSYKQDFVYPAVSEHELRITNIHISCIVEQNCFGTKNWFNQYLYCIWNLRILFKWTVSSVSKGAEVTSFSALNSTKQIVTPCIHYTSQLSRVRSEQTSDDLRDVRIAPFPALSQSALRVFYAGLCELQVSLTTQPSRGTPSHPHTPPTSGDSDNLDLIPSDNRKHSEAVSLYFLL